MNKEPSTLTASQYTDTSFPLPSRTSFNVTEEELSGASETLTSTGTFKKATSPFANSDVMLINFVVVGPRVGDDGVTIVLSKYADREIYYHKKVLKNKPQYNIKSNPPEFV